MELGDGHSVQQALEHRSTEALCLPTIARQPCKPHTQSQTRAGVSEAVVALRMRHSARLGGIMGHLHDSAEPIADMHSSTDSEGSADSVQMPLCLIGRRAAKKIKNCPSCASTRTRAGVGETG